MMRGNPRMAKPEFFDTPGYGEIARTRNYYSQALRSGDVPRVLPVVALSRLHHRLGDD